MKIGVISDTHIPRAAAKLPDTVFSIFMGCEVIIHAGDIVEVSVLEELGRIAPVEAVWGNRDSENLKSMLPEQRIFEFGNFRIGVFHGHGDKGTTMQRLPEFFKGMALDCIIFGHSHIPFNEIISGTLYFNPGSPTVKKRQKYGSVGILTLGETIIGELHYIV